MTISIVSDLFIIDMMDFLINLDTDIFLYLNEIHAPFWDKFMWMFSGKFLWIPMYIMFLIVFFKDYGWKRAVILMVAMAIAVTLADQICGNYLRYYFTRLRPANPDNPISMMVHIVEGYRGGAYGFPSCHAANSFALAVFSALLFKKRRFVAFIFLWALVNAYSRIYLGVHYPGDLIVGAIIGGLAGTLCYWLARRAVSRWMEPGQRSLVPAERCLTVNGRAFMYRDCDYMIGMGIVIAVVIALVSLG